MIARRSLGISICFSLLCWGTAAPAMDNVLVPLVPTTIGAMADNDGGSVTILRGTPRQRDEPAADPVASKPRVVSAGVVGTGNNLWYIGADERIHACWLTGTGYVNSLKVVCTR